MVLEIRQATLLPDPTGDERLLIPGWGGELGPDEFEYILESLLRDKKLSFSWGFQPAKRRRQEWAIKQIAEWGDSERRAINMALARQRLPDTVLFRIEV